MLPIFNKKMLTEQEYFNTWYHPHHIIDSVPHSLVIKVNNIPIGYVSSYWVDKATQWLEIGIVVYDSSYWNGGFGSEAFYLWVGYLFKETRLHRLGISTWSGNKRMIQAAKKSGMVEEARIRQARIVNNEYFDAVKMGILKSEWETFHN
ncbi:GNAT family protein [Sinobaca sp. H24]|uniref:GNAT family N-acetyltransferase n=1 Tax=Sinobaca sp. H24 TaxID=2923376 RepID=UPI0027E29450|nr:GNAT family protein [Sinobaca sp. H24]